MQRTRLQLNRSDLHAFGRDLIRLIREEAKKDAAKSTMIPDIKDFYDSFTYRIEGNDVIVESTWEWLDILTEGTKGPYPMKWLTAAQGVPKIPLRDRNGGLTFRNTPLTTDKAWIHPKIAQHTFIQRALDKATDIYMRKVVEQNLEGILMAAFKRG